MTLRDIVQRLALEVVVDGGGLDREVSGGFSGDLLSNVLAAARPGNLWITIQRHVNVVGVAQVAGLSGVLLAGGEAPALAVVAKAEEMGIPILLAPDAAFELAGRLHRVLIPEET
ncbi:MAG: DRTGG domain-containing protein [Candidatus Bipolaricaulis sp.]|nr:DRTGG domain-containing protein [Candidatus Bipolaricaulis sp.]